MFISAPPIIRAAVRSATRIQLTSDKRTSRASGIPVRRNGRFTSKWRCQCGCRMLADFRGPIWAGSASIRRDRLPKLDTISFWIGAPAELPEIVAFAFWIDRDAFVYQTVQHTIEVIHLEIDHCFLCRREVCIVLFEEGEDDLSVLRRGRKRGRSLGLHQIEMPLVPLIQSFWIIRSQKHTAKASN